MEGDEHDGEDDPTVLVDITGSHPEDPGGRVGREGGCLGYGRQERSPGVVRADVSVLLLPGQTVRPVINCAGQHTAGVEPDAGLTTQKYSIVNTK